MYWQYNQKLFEMQFEPFLFVTVVILIETDIGNETNVFSDNITWQIF